MVDDEFDNVMNHGYYTCMDYCIFVFDKYNFDLAKHEYWIILYRI